ncbi:MAG: O-antigen ligase family protein [Oligoflexales bacterium]|nr:O-antigen ligase family protein [Oligoflexales bacterium]
MSKKFAYIFPVCLFAGVALQALGFYLFALLIPLLWVSSLPLEKMVLGRLKKISLALMGLFLIFPICSLWNSLFLPPQMISSFLPKDLSLPGKDLLRSSLSSAVFLSGGTLLCFCLFKKNGQEKKIGKHWADLKAFHSHFLSGFFFATVCLLVFVLLQQFLGFDYRVSGMILPDHERLESGFYRSPGLYGHPLSLAAVALGLFTFFGYLATEKWGSWLHHRFFSRGEPQAEILNLLGEDSWKVRIYLSLISLFHLYFVVASGGRTATFIAISFLLVFCTRIFYQASGWKFFSWKSFIFLNVFPPILLALLMPLLPMLSRFRGLLADPGSTFLQHFDRLKFWIVHWYMFQDKPWLGQGLAQLHSGYREAYYEALGFGWLRDKFNAHNLYLEILAEVGIVGALSFFLFSFLAMRQLKGLSRARGSYILYQAFLWAILANLFHSFTQNVFFDSNVTLIYLSLFFLVIWFSLTNIFRQEFQ